VNLKLLKIACEKCDGLINITHDEECPEISISKTKCPYCGKKTKVVCDLIRPRLIDLGIPHIYFIASSEWLEKSLLRL